MHHKAHIGLVDAHPERNRGDHDLSVIADEGLLIAAALGVFQPGMVGQYRVSSPFEKISQFIHLFTRKAVNDARLILVSLQKLDGLESGIAFGDHFDEQVFAVKAGDKLVRLGKAKAGFDVRADSRGGRRRECLAYSGGEALAHSSYLAIFRAKVMSPL